MSRSGRVGFVVLSVAALLAALLAALVYRTGPVAAQGAPPGATIEVDTAQDAASGGDCSLREAIRAANTNAAVGGCAAGVPGASDRISFSLGQGESTITLNSTLPVVTGRGGLTIDGGQGARTTVSGDDQVRVLVVKKGAQLTLRRLTVTGGSVSESSSAAAAGSGGGVANRGGSLTVVRSTFVGNEVIEFGGAISNLNAAGEVRVVNSTFVSNKAEAGGAILNAGKLGVGYSTFARNSAEFVGGGIQNSNASAARTTIGSTIFANNAKGNVNNTSAGGTSKGKIFDAGYNISSGGPFRFTAATSRNNTDPRLSTAGLRDNGGPTDTIALRGNSPALNAIPRGTNNCGTVLTVDQRGEPRPQGNRCDAGAFERAAQP